MPSDLIPAPGNLLQCNKYWGIDVHLNDFIHHLGNSRAFETKVKGVIGLNGNEPGTGPSFVLQDIENSPIEILWTAGLTGCIGLAITGRDETGQLNVFFTHARHYDKESAPFDENNPIYWARLFIQNHQQIRVFWGSDFFFGTKNSREGVDARQMAQIKLSNALGCWVRLTDCVTSDALVFLPKMGLMRPGMPNEVLHHLEREQHLEGKILFSASKALQNFEPNMNLLDLINKKLDSAKRSRGNFLRFYLQDNYRNTKISVLQLLSEAYQVGNYDIIYHLAIHANRGTPPFASSDKKHNRMSPNIAKLVLAVFEDTLQKIRGTEESGCGLADNGFQMDYKDYEKATLFLSSRPSP